MHITNKMTVNEDAPANSAGGGNIAGIGVGPKGEPGVPVKSVSRYKKNNKREAPGPIMTPMQKRKTFSQFITGK